MYAGNGNKLAGAGSIDRRETSRFFVFILYLFMVYLTVLLISDAKCR
jgi:hypothetical protein